MSSVLDAVRELDGQKPPAPPDPKWPVEWWAIGAAVGSALAAAVIVLVIVLLLRPSQAPAPARDAAPREAAAVPSVSRSAAKPAPGWSNAEVPWARTGAARSTAPAAAPERKVAAVRPAKETVPPRADVIAPTPSRPAAGGPVVVESVGVGPTGQERTVALAINGAKAVTLRQGESAGGYEVQLILPDAVYLRHGGNVFALDVPH